MINSCQIQVSLVLANSCSMFTSIIDRCIEQTLLLNLFLQYIWAGLCWLLARWTWLWWFIHLALIGYPVYPTISSHRKPGWSSYNCDKHSPFPCAVVTISLFTRCDAQNIYILLKSVMTLVTATMVLRRSNNYSTHKQHVPLWVIKYIMTECILQCYDLQLEF